MSEQSAIEWTDATWNPVTGCTKGAIPVLLHPDRLEQPLRWRKPRRVFVCSLADLFHEDVPDAFIAAIFDTMASAQQHTFQVLTKRPERMREICSRLAYDDRTEPGGAFWYHTPIPLPNVWLGVSVENQRMADERIPVLLDTPAAVRFLSCEPLGPLELSGQGTRADYLRRGWAWDYSGGSRRRVEGRRIDWVICGGESGPGSAERKLVEWCDCAFGFPGPGIDQADGPVTEDESYEMCRGCDGTGWRPKPQALAMVRDIRDQCVAAGVAYYFKQWPMPPGKPGGPALIDGREWRQMP